MAVVINANVGGSSLSNVISFNARAGRSNKTEVYSSSRAQITVRVPSAIPAAFVLEALVSVDIDGMNVHSGYITNIEYNYGIVAAMDTATISLEGFLSFLGRGQLNNFALTGTSTGLQAQRIGTSLSGSAKTITDSKTRSLTDSTTVYTGSAQNLITGLVAMEQGRLAEGSGQMYFRGRDVLQNPAAFPFGYNWAFTDVPASGPFFYDLITFASLTDNYFTQTVVTPATVAAQGEGTGSRVLSVNTYDPTTTQADNLASYMLAEFDNNTSVPTSISTSSAVKNGVDVNQIPAERAIGWQLPITFRGTVYNTIIEGWTISANPELVRYSFDLSGYEQNNYFILNDAVYGRLDFNQLSF